MLQDLTNHHHDNIKLSLTSKDLSSTTTSDEQLIANTKYDLMTEYNALQNELQYIYALEQRNEAQLGSFVSVEAQWIAQDEDDRTMLSKKEEIERRMEVLFNTIIRPMKPGDDR